MSESPTPIARLRSLAVTATLSSARLSTAMIVDEAAWLTDGLGRAQLHELFAIDADEAAAAAGFAVAVAIAGKALPVLWLRTMTAERRGGRLRAGGLGELGLDSRAVVLGVVADEAALLRAAADAARCPGLGTLIVEAWGPAPGIDLTATRRLMLAAEASGATVLMVRIGAEPRPSATATRWSVAAAPSTALDADAPGVPAFAVECLRRRGGPAGRQWRVEWDRDATCFRNAPLPGADLPLVADRTSALDSPAFVRRTG
nr:hypothetical protein [Sphingomonas bacterium]